MLTHLTTVQMRDERFFVEVPGHSDQCVRRPVLRAFYAKSRSRCGSSTSCVTGILISKVCCALPRDAITSQRSRAKIRRAPYVYVFECLTETLLAFEPLI